MTEKITQKFRTDLSQLLKDVPQVPIIGSPGIVTVFGTKAFPFIVGKYKECFHALAAAGRLGDGRIVIYGHDGYLNPSDAYANLNQLIVNNVVWCANKEDSKCKITVGLHNKYKNNVPFFQDEQGFLAKSIHDCDVLNLEKLLEFDVLCIQNVGIISVAAVENIKAFVKAGRGLIAGNTAWAWDYYGPGGDIRSDHSGNLITHEAGIGWTVSGYLEENSPDVGRAFTTDTHFLDNCHALEVWNSMSKAIRNKSKFGDIQKHFSILEEAVNSMPHQNQELLNEIISEIQDMKVCLPTKHKPVFEPLEKLILVLISSLNQAGHRPKVGLMNVDYEFPGKVDKDVSRLQDQWIELNINHEGMYSTGFYAAPGDLLDFEFASPIKVEGLRIQIGCHIDDISCHKEWSRCPKIVSKKIVYSGDTKVFGTNVFGGLVYINIYKNADKFGHLRMKINGGIPAPYFVLGKTSVWDWRENIRWRQAPWAELANGHIILTLPSTQICKIEDPEPLLMFWQKIIEADADLAGIERVRSKPERIVADIQISCGYMHSGYPIMIHTDIAVETALSIKKLQSTDAWGHFHELGHNHQHSDWTFEGTGEVTCNLFTLYVLTTVCGLTFPEARDVFQPENMKRTVTSFIDAGRNFENWKSDPFLALLFYYQLQQAFGWEAFKAVFAQYRNLTNDERPKHNQQKMDLWLRMFSKVVGFNLGDFFISWNIPVSRSAINLISDLRESTLSINSLLCM